MLYLSRMTRQHVTVALCGDGADELFGGYRRYHSGVLEERLRRKFPAFFRRSVIRAGEQVIRNSISSRGYSAPKHY